MTYGWAILIIVIVAGVLYSFGIFNPSSSASSTVTGFSGLGSVQAECYSNLTYAYGVPGTNAGGLLISIGNLNPNSVNITQINATSNTGVLNSYIETFNSSETPSIIVQESGRGYAFIPLVCPKNPGSRYSITVSIAYELIGSVFPGPYYSAGTITGISAIGQITNVTSDTIGLTDYWPFSKGSGTTAYDVSGHVVNGVISGATWVTGSFGTALNFASGNYMEATYPATECGAVPSIPCNAGSVIGSPGEMYLPTLDTFTMWVNPAALGVAIAGAVNGGCDRTIGLNGSGYLGAYVWSGGPNNAFNTPTLSANTWYFLVFTMQSNRFAFYVNGQLYGASTTGTNNGIEGTFSSGFAGAQSFEIGADGCDSFGAGNFVGMVKGVRVYNHGLNQQEIQDIYQYNALI